jgi:hypothetical protein
MSTLKLSFVPCACNVWFKPEYRVTMTRGRLHPPIQFTYALYVPAPLTL